MRGLQEEPTKKSCTFVLAELHRTMKKNLFLALEGIDGSGKSTQTRLLTERLKAAGHRVYTTFEPTDSPIGSLIRNIFSRRVEADHRTIAGLFVADRLDHLLNQTNGILKKLDEGYTVITDRYYFSSYAYQGAHVPMDWVIQANSLSAELLRPSLNIFLDIAPELAMERLQQGRSNIDLYETLSNLRAVKERYDEAFEQMAGLERVVRIDANRLPETVEEDVWNAVQQI